MGRAGTFAIALMATLSLLASTTSTDAEAATSPVAIEVAVSTADGHARVQETTRLVTPEPSSGPSVEVDLDRPRQRLRGVGAALTESSAYLIAGLPAAERHRLLETLFDPATGGLSVVRLVIGASDFSIEHHSLDDSPVPDLDLSSFSIDRDRRWVIPVLREMLAINPNLTLVASPWSAPGWMKDSGLYTYGSLKPEYEQVYARYLVRYLEAYRAEGIDIAWLTVQNEPAAIQLTYPSMFMSPEQQVRLLRDQLAPDLVAASLDTRVLAWDHNWCDAKVPGGCAGPAPPLFALEVLAATGGAYPLGGTALHCYGGDQVTANEAIHQTAPTLEIWETECSGGDFQGSREQAFGEATRRVLADWNHWANVSLLWNIALDPDHGPHLGGCDTCRGLVTVDPATGTWVPEVDRDVLATIGRFGPQGSGVLETRVSPSADLTAVGVCGPDHRPAAILWNPGPADTVTVRFGALVLPLDLATGSLTTVRAPEGQRCVLAPMPALPGPPTTVPPTTEPPTTTTTEVSTTEPTTTTTSEVAGIEPTMTSTEPTTTADVASIEPTTTTGATRPGRSTRIGSARPAAAVDGDPRFTG